MSYHYFMWGNIPKLLLVIQFAFAGLLLSSFMGGMDERNKPICQVLIEDLGWSTNIVFAASEKARNTFMNILSNPSTYRKVFLVQQLTGCKAIHEMESPSFRASFLIPMFSLIENDINWWCALLISTKLTIFQI